MTKKSLACEGNLRLLAKRLECLPEDIIDFSSGINPCGPFFPLNAIINNHFDGLGAYFDPDGKQLVIELAELWNRASEEIVLGNGSNELFYAFTRLPQVKRVLTLNPSNCTYSNAAYASGKTSLSFDMKKNDFGFEIDYDQLETYIVEGDLVFISNPNNPTGGVANRDRIYKLITNNRHVLFVIDEAFIDFSDEDISLIHEQERNLIVTRSITEFFAIPGIVLGACVANLELAMEIKKQIPEGSVNNLTQLIGMKCVTSQNEIHKTKGSLGELQNKFKMQLDECGYFHVYPSGVNFFLCHWKIEPKRIDDVMDDLLTKYHIALLSCENFEALSNEYVRIDVRSEVENRLLINALNEILKPSVSKKLKPKIKRTLMFQGTGSNAGKSMMTAALCRILKQDGVKVAPFKSQNMSNNSYVTHDGKEIARAQVVQAQACGIPADARFSPILLKPTDEKGSQVIVGGRPVSHMNIQEYHAYKETSFKKVKEDFEAICSEYDAVIMEGAGSPGEINLKSHDIVNMNMAKVANSPVLLVGNIHLGGVYAAFAGTMSMLEPWERKLIKGYLVNNFRGDSSLLTPAHDYLLDYTGKLVIGVVPHIDELNIPEEDSVNFKDYWKPNCLDTEKLDIAVLDLPFISNFTDFDPLKLEGVVNFRKLSSLEEWGNPHVIIIPGSKNTLFDLEYLIKKGFGKKILAHAQQGKIIIGICGGFQMLGKFIYDPYGIESSKTKSEGLNLLSIETTMEKDKSLKQVKTKHTQSGIEVSGYEIHHGQSIHTNMKPLFDTDETLGLSNPSGNIWGSYLHGLFDEDAFRHWFINDMLEFHQLSPVNNQKSSYDIEPNLDRLADVFRENVDMKLVYQLLGL